MKKINQNVGENEWPKYNSIFCFPTKISESANNLFYHFCFIVDFKG